jgi:hypothetical protein
MYKTGFGMDETWMSTGWLWWHVLLYSRSLVPDGKQLPLSLKRVLHSHFLVSLSLLFSLHHCSSWQNGIGDDFGLSMFLVIACPFV